MTLHFITFLVGNIASGGNPYFIHFLFLSNLTQLNQSEVSQCLESILGPQQMQNHLVLVLVTIFYLLLFLGGVLGNLLVCVVIIKSKELHSAMNYYLLSLAVADLTLITTGMFFLIQIFLLF